MLFVDSIFSLRLVFAGHSEMKRFGQTSSWYYNWQLFFSACWIDVHEAISKAVVCIKQLGRFGVFFKAFQYKKAQVGWISVSTAGNADYLDLALLYSSSTLSQGVALNVVLHVILMCCMLHVMCMEPWKVVVCKKQKHGSKSVKEWIKCCV